MRTVGSSRISKRPPRNFRHFAMIGIPVVILLFVPQLVFAVGDMFLISKNASTGEPLCYANDDPDRVATVRSISECAMLCETWSPCREFTCWTTENSTALRTAFQCELHSNNPLFISRNTHWLCPFYQEITSKNAK